jgi:hypothetical protein
MPEQIYLISIVIGLVFSVLNSVMGFTTEPTRLHAGLGWVVASMFFLGNILSTIS